jgi:hypothetical protein
MRLFRRNTTRPAVPGGSRRDFFGDAHTLKAPEVPPVKAVPVPPVHVPGAVRRAA